METALPLTTVEVIDLTKSVTPPTDGIISRTIYQDSSVKAVLFGFGPGQELSEHTASKPAIMHFLTGESEVTLGDRNLNATAGTWVHMAAGQPHSIVFLIRIGSVLWAIRQSCRIQAALRSRRTTVNYTAPALLAVNMC
jgi:hypothetical protein